MIPGADTISSARPEDPAAPFDDGASWPGYDEGGSASGAVRADWDTLRGELRALGPEQLARRWEQGQRLIEENGVTYNVYRDPRGTDRPWQLDAVPLLIPVAEWSGIESAIVQRATLFSRILEDFYGEARTVRSGLVPPALLYSNPGFLRPCHGLPGRFGPALPLYSADLARSPDGRWRVLADRTQAPSGAGYALENRVVLSRILPELFRSFHVRRLAGYFQAFRDALIGLGAERSDDPQVVLLTPGPYNETYFEHAYLARYLGFPLVEGGDLTVRDERLHVKTLSGLRPVDVVLRRQDDHFCDPLELYGESALGVAGLVQAARSGNVAVVNSLGSGVVESPALMPFLPALSRSLLGEDLQIPSVATWWCGEEGAKEHVTAAMGDLVIKQAFPGLGQDVRFGGELDAKDRERMARALRAEPGRYVAQEQVPLSTVPTGLGDDSEPRPVVLRVFAVATPDGYAVMPGGLTRFSSARDNLVVSSQSGGGSKDTWVVDDETRPWVSMMQRVTRPIDVRRDTYALTSRMADNLFWLGRTTERLEAGTRLVRTTLRSLVESMGREPRDGAGAAIDLMRRMGRLDAGPADRRTGGTLTFERQISRGLFDAGFAGSLRSDAAELHRLARLVRERISPDAWRAVTSLEPRFTEPDVAPLLWAGDVLETLDDVLLTLSAFTGLTMESTTRGLGWRFLDVGRRLERALQMVALLRSGLTDDLPPGSRRLHALLEVADSSMTYRSRYMTSVQRFLVVDLLLLDDGNPRSVAFQLERLGDHLAELDRAPDTTLFAEFEELRSIGARSLAQESSGGRATAGSSKRSRLDARLDRLTEALRDLSDGLDRAYLSHAVPLRTPPVPVGGRG